MDSMLRVDPVDVLTGKESEAKIRKFFGDVAKFQKARNINNKDIVRELEPFLDGRARDLYLLAKHKRGYIDYNVTLWEPEPTIPAVQQEVDAVGHIVVAASPEVPAIPKTLITLFKDQLLKEANEDTIRLKIKNTGKQRAGELFNEFADRTRLMVYQLHLYTYTEQQRNLDEEHTKEFQETMVLLKENSHRKLWDFLISQSHLTETARTQQAFDNAKFGAKIWESSSEGAAFLALGNKTKMLPTPAPVVPSLADPVAGAMSTLTLGKQKQKGRNKKAKKGNSQPQPNKQAKGTACTYCGIPNHTIQACYKKKHNEKNGIFRDKVEGFPLKPYKMNRMKANSSLAPTNRSEHPEQNQPTQWGNLSSIEWGQILQGTQPHGDLQANRCNGPTP